MDAQPRMPDGPVAVNVFARFDEGWREFKEVCFRMRMGGAKPLRVEKVEHGEG